MHAKTMMVVLILAALAVTGAVAMHGHGHRFMRRWMPALHGGR